ncbi:MAG: type VII toxin-antitoxin system HepT family RNase toxin [Candidatus Njordarchaeales archaeon]
MIWFSKHDVESIIRDLILLNSVLHILQTSIQALIDIGARVLSESGVKPPSIYKEIAEDLAEKEFLSPDEAKLLSKIIGFRNVLVHAYLRINLELLREILNKKKYEDVMKLAIKIVEEAQKAGIDP